MKGAAYPLKHFKSGFEKRKGKMNIYMYIYVILLCKITYCINFIARYDEI